MIARRVYGLAAMAGLGLLITFAVLAGRRSDDLAVNVAGARRSVDAPAASCRFDIGERLAFELWSSTATLLAGRGSGRHRSAPTRAERQSLRAKLLWHVDARSAEGYLISAALTEIECDSSEPSTCKKLVPGLSEPFALRMAKDCSFRGIGFGNHAQPAQRAIAGLFKSAEFVARPAYESSWQTVQDDGLGSYEAAYERSDDGTRLEKRRVAYTALRAPAAGISASARVLASRALIVLEPRGRWARALDDEERVALSVGGKRIASTTSELHVQSVRAPTTLARLVPEPDALNWVNAVPVSLELHPLTVADPPRELFELTLERARNRFLTRL